MLDIKKPEVRFALDAVRQASGLVKKVQSQQASVSTHTKNDRSPVTVADFAAQAVVAYHLSRLFPQDVLVGEENAEILRSGEGKVILAEVTRFVSEFIPEVTPEKICDWVDRGTGEPGERYWTLDPVDGTKGFLRGEQYAIAFALIVKGRVEIGVMGCPNLTGAKIPEVGGPGSLIIAVKGEGAWTTPVEEKENFTRLHVSSCSDIAQARILSSVESGHTNTGHLDQLLQKMSVHVPPILMDSQAKHIVLAAGGAELLFRFLSPKYPDYKEKIWDQAAGALIVEEAGGCVTDLSGKALDFSKGRTLSDNKGIMISNGLLHTQVLTTLNNFVTR